MLDVQLLRNDVHAVAARLAGRGFALDTHQFNELEAQRKQLQVQSEELQAQVNVLSKQIGELMKQGKRDEAETAKTQVAEIKSNKNNSTKPCPTFRQLWTICC